MHFSGVDQNKLIIIGSIISTAAIEIIYAAKYKLDDIVIMKMPRKTVADEIVTGEIDIEEMVASPKSKLSSRFMTLHPIKLLNRHTLHLPLV